MRVAAIELFVDLLESDEPPATAVRRALVRNADRRNEQALSAIQAALKLAPDVILCPGWTFVGDTYPNALRSLVGGTTLIFEVHPEEEPPASLEGQGHGKGQEKGERPQEGKSAQKQQGDGDSHFFPWRTFVVESWKLREVPRQVIALGTELNEPTMAQALATALKSPERRVVDEYLLICGETQAVRIEYTPKARYEWDRGVADHGVPKQAFKGRTVFNPAHTPSGSRMHEKRKRGPWRALVTTANQFDRTRLGLNGRVPEPTRAYIDAQEIAVPEFVEVGAKDYVTLFDLS
jgi:hypothetical protein